MTLSIPAAATSSGMRTGPRLEDETGGGLDITNQAILRLLAQQGRSSMREVALGVGRLEGTVRERVAALERRGVVTGYEARIEWGLVGLPLLVVVQGSCAADRFEAVASQLRGLPNVLQALTMTGTPNVVVMMRARDMHAVRQALETLSRGPLEGLDVRVAIDRLVPERQPLEALAGALPALQARMGMLSAVRMPEAPRAAARASGTPSPALARHAGRASQELGSRAMA